MRSVMSLAVIARDSRVTTTSLKPPVSSPVESYGRSASVMRATCTAPVWPRSGARNTGTSAAAPAFSTRSPMRTISELTVTSSLSRGAAGAVSARGLATERGQS